MEYYTALFDVLYEKKKTVGTDRFSVKHFTIKLNQKRSLKQKNKNKIYKIALDVYFRTTKIQIPTDHAPNSLILLRDLRQSIRKDLYK